MIQFLTFYRNKDFYNYLSLHVSASDSGKNKDLLIFPTSRSIRKMARTIIEAKKSLKMMSIQDFYRYTVKCKTAQLPDELRYFVLKKAVEKLGDTDKKTLLKDSSERLLKDFIEFAGAGSAVFKLYREILSEFIEFNELKKESLYTDYEVQADVLERLFDSYRTIVHELGYVDSCEIYNNFELDYEFINSYEKYFVVVSGMLTAFEMSVLKQVGDIADVELIFTWSGGGEQYHKKFNQYLGFEIEPMPEYKFENIQVTACTSRSQEYELAVSSVVSFINQGYDAEDIAVVMGDESIKEFFLKNDRLNLFNVSGGIPVEFSTIYQLIDNILKVYDKKNEFGFSITELKSFFSHSFFGEEGIKAARSLDYKMREGRLVITEQETEELFCEGFKILTSFSFDAEFLPSEICSEFIIFIQELNFRIEGFVEKEFASQFLLNLNRLKIIYRIIDEKINFIAGAKHLLSSLSDVSVGIPGGPVTVLGVLETRNMNYRAVVALSINSGVFPPENEKDLYLNTELRQRLGLPTFADRDSLVKSYLFSVLERSERAVVSYVHGSGGNIRSRAVEEIISVTGVEAENYRQTEIFGMPSINLYGSSPIIYADESRVEDIKKHGFTPSMINSFLRCPYLYCLRNINGLKEPAGKREHLGGEMIGGAMHKAVEIVYKNGVPNDPEIFYQKLKEEFSANINKYDSVRVRITEKYRSEMLGQSLKKFVAEEIKRFSEGVTPLEFEKKVSTEIQGVKFRGVIDRIDAVKGGKAVIDYKFRDVKTINKFNPETIEDVQMPIYAMMFNGEENVMPVFTGWYDMKNKFELIPAFDEANFYLLEEFILETAHRLFDPSTPYEKTTKISRCKTCNYRHICGRA